MHRTEPMTVKHWSRAGLLCTNRCTASCAACYLSCADGQGQDMPPDLALHAWRGLIESSPHGCRIHLTGGEPFLCWQNLLRIAQRAQAEGLMPLESVETNAFWAEDDGLIRDRLLALDAAGMGRLAISADPFHQEFVPLERPRRLARLAGEILGPQRVRVRWEDWLEDGEDLLDMEEARRRDIQAQWIALGRDRLNGRAAETMARYLPSRPPDDHAGPCAATLLRGKHVHVHPDGSVFPGVCAGIVLGRAGEESMPAMWRRLVDDWSRRPILGTLAEEGAVGLMYLAAAHGFRGRDGYAGRCHLCYDVRGWLYGQGLYRDELGPAWVYDSPAEAPETA